MLLNYRLRLIFTDVFIPLFRIFLDEGLHEIIAGRVKGCNDFHTSRSQKFLFAYEGFVLPNYTARDFIL
jgi:hypothetical protein